MHSTGHPLVKSENDRVWRRYCGFLDLNIDQFMSIQELMLIQQLERVSGCSLGKRMLCQHVPSSVEEYRHEVPLTVYDDYFPELDTGNEQSLPESPYAWASTSGAGGIRRCVPYTREAYEKSLDNLMAAFILACSRQRGQSSLVEGDRVLYNVAPSPYLSGILATGASRVFNLKSVMPPDMHDNMDFRDKVTKGFEISLRTGMDLLVAMTSVLVKTGNEFNSMSRSKKDGIIKHLAHPGEFARILRAYLRSKLENRRMLPKDLWPVKAIIGWGIDTSIYRDTIYRYWGAYPYEFHACTEAGIFALQNWTRRGMTFIPHSNFFEFIPESEWEKSRGDVFYEPRTVLLPEVEEGKRYELVITSFYGMPFIRYRLGHLVRIIALEDEEAQVALPQMVFEARADDLLDIAGFTRVSEKTITQAIANAGVEVEEWSARKELKFGKPLLHLYMEVNKTYRKEELALLVHAELMKTDPGYHDLVSMMEIEPMRVTLLSPGTFGNFYRERKEKGLELAQLRPPRINAPDDVIEELLNFGKREPIAIT